MTNHKKEPVMTSIKDPRTPGRRPRPVVSENPRIWTTNGWRYR